MLELKHSNGWDRLNAVVLPTTNLTTAEKKRLQQRDELIDAALQEIKKPEVFIRINHGIHKGSIIKISAADKESTIHLYEEDYGKRVTGPLSNYLKRYGKKDLDPTKGWQFNSRCVTFHIHFKGTIKNGRLKINPIKLKDGWLFPQFMNGEVLSGMSLLIGYEGDDVFVLNEQKRPPTFLDRLDQEVKVGDLVVVALNYGAGLDVCMVRGFSDEDRVVIESVNTREFDRIVIENGSTRKIMKMLNDLRTTAMIMKLGRD